MTGLSKITDKILAEARADANAKLAEAEERCRQIARDADEVSAERCAKIDEATKREAAEIVTRAKSGDAMVYRNTVLEARSALIDEAFEAAHKEILNLSAERTLEMLTMLLSSALRQISEDEKTSRELYGESEIPAAEQYEILLNQRDLDRCGKALLREAKQRLGQVADKLVLSEEPVFIDGGLIVRCGDIEINCSLGAMFSEIRPRLEAKVSRTLFPEKAVKSDGEQTTKKGS